MFRTKVSEMSALAGFVPAGKPANCKERFCSATQYQLECRGHATHPPRLAGLLWLACALAAMGMSSAHAQTGAETVLYNFALAPKGASPFASVIRDPVGNLYGTTYVGGAANAGVVFKMDTASHETVLYSFTGGADGQTPTPL